ncbi:hypothetical protein M0M57_12370 [Flavobacterium azooxidireducens]|uniref:Uncharacterized protein n=1 Tax=Flavobacterium azooxidireducens TaxID=1871076 RepID=A0ABY4KC98_9FLAO|nr:hypothetical protein [Flavobacterium azooxidireducens]UPQ78411.1 hypothetical protein M0M57_12370 [Flavobacterium azooxidireducens]
MNIDALKLEIIAKIIATNDVELLNKIQEMISFYQTNTMVNEPPSTYQKTTNQKVRVFNEREQKRIDKALDQHKNGECISDEEADKEIQKWLED